MDAKKLKLGMEVKYANGNVVKVTHVPKVDKYGECFFSGILLKTQLRFMEEYIGKNLNNNWNSASCFPN